VNKYVSGTYAKIYILAAGCAVILSACGGGGSNASDSENASGNTDTSAIEGLWDATSGDDIQYLQYTADGIYYIWDYEGDAAGSGENCYDRSPGFPILNLGGNRYDGLGEIATIVVNGDSMTLSDSFGTDVFPRVTGVAIADLNEC
jgi:hypothetical protein